MQVGDTVKTTNGVQFITHDGGMHVLRNLGWLKNADKFGKITVGNNVFIGNRCLILPGVAIGNNVVIGAGSIVTKDIPDDSVAVGVPAKVIENISEYFAKSRDCVDFTKTFRPNEKRIYLMKKYNCLFDES